jgi:hypothetical protein
VIIVVIKGLAGSLTTLRIIAGWGRKNNEFGEHWFHLGKDKL